jgi:hypothetical protein
MSDQVPHSTVEEFNCQTVRQGDNRKATAGMVLGIVGMAGVAIFPPLMAMGIWFMYWGLVYLSVCLWAAIAIAGLCLSVAGVKISRETISARGVGVTGIVLSSIALALMTVQAIIAVQICT